MTIIEQLNGYVTDLRNGNSVNIGSYRIMPQGKDRFQIWKGKQLKEEQWIGARTAVQHVVLTSMAT